MTHLAHLVNKEPLSACLIIYSLTSSFLVLYRASAKWGVSAVLLVERSCACCVGWWNHLVREERYLGQIPRCCLNGPSHRPWIHDFGIHLLLFPISSKSKSHYPIMRKNQFFFFEREVIKGFALETPKRDETGTHEVYKQHPKKLSSKETKKVFPLPNK